MKGEIAVRKLARIAGLAVTTATALSLITLQASAHDPSTKEGKAAVEAFMADHQPAVRMAPIAGEKVPCVDGKAGNYPCKNVDLLSVLPLSSMGGGNGNSMWGWTDPSGGKEYIIFGRSNGAAFVDVSDPVNPRYLGNLPSHTGSTSMWRDIKVYKNHAFIGADMIQGHGLQVFDLTRLRNVTSPQTFTEDAHYSGFGPSHTLAINEDTGFLYAVGTNTCAGGPDNKNGGPHMVDVRDPKNPKNAGCVGQDGYTHENQCVVYNGPDAEHRGKEICFNYNEDTLTIVDVTTKSAPKQLSRTGYTNNKFTHQGWLTEDHAYLAMNDELDNDPRTLIWDVKDLDKPVWSGTYQPGASVGQAVDHNEYFVGDYLYQAQYRSGLHILDGKEVASGKLTEVGYFDIYPSDNNNGFNGAWNTYPFFASGTVAISGIEQGLILVKPNLGTVEPPPPACGKSSNDTNVDIPDAGAAVTSSIDVAGCTGTVSASAPVEVHIKHPYRGDLVIDLIAPDGTSYSLKKASFDSADDINQTYQVNVAGETRNGTWKLKVQDVYRYDVGYIDSWSLQP